MGRGRPGTGGQLRIIGGRWRGRRLPVLDKPGLRPTGDRIRETLFNWLAADLPGARCLDLFAGSGALGLEALSRGAAHCDFVDNGRGVAAALDEQLRRLDARECAAVHCCEATRFLSNASNHYDLLFLDPPFAAGCLDDTCARLAASGVLAQGAIIYLEHALRQLVQVPDDWSVHRDRTAGEVRFALYTT